MKPRDVKLSRRVAIDYLLIGIALGGSSQAVASRLQPNEMLTKRGRHLLRVALDGQRKAIVDAFGVNGHKIHDGECVCDGIIRIIKESNAEQSAYSLGEYMSEELASFTDLDDMVDLLERATSAMKTFQENFTEARKK